MAKKNIKKLNLKKSKILFKEAKKIIPLGTQTFSRSHLFFDKNYFPLFLKRGNKQFVTDIDGNKYLDFINALGSVSIGYGIKSVNQKINRNINDGNCFTLSHPLEVKISKKLIKLIPSAEMVRFGKNGTDVNSAAIRLARHYTKKDIIAVCGYHGWQDWYIASTQMNSGVPKTLNKYVKKFMYNNILSLEKILMKKNCAAVIMEPLSYSLPKNNFLYEVRKLCKKYKVLLIFDEICTGFRVSLGGAQKIYNVTPDISTFGKAMANGFPLSAIVGKKKIMKHMSKIFYSGTFAGEIASLSACEATIDFLLKEKSISKNIVKGKFLKTELQKIINKRKLSKVLSIDGHSSWLFLRVLDYKNYNTQAIMAYIRQELIINKILFLGSFNITHSHTLGDIKKLIKYLDQIFYFIEKKIDSIDQFVKIKYSKNVFEIRKFNKKK